MHSHSQGDPEPVAQLPGAEPNAGKKGKGRKKLKAAWIALFGRILAQVIGAAATVALGVVVVQRWPGALPEPARPMARPASPASAKAGERAAGQPRSVDEVFAELDQDRDGRLTAAEVPEETWLRLVRADANGDGVVTKGELHEGRARARYAFGDPR